MNIRRPDRDGVSGLSVTRALVEWESLDEEGVKTNGKLLVLCGEKPKEAAVGGVLNANLESLGGEKSKVEEEGTAVGRV